MSPWITVNNEYIGRTPEFSAWLSQTLNIASKGNAVLYTRMANKECVFRCRVFATCSESLSYTLSCVVVACLALQVQVVH